MSTHASARASGIRHLIRTALLAATIAWGWAEPARGDLVWEGLPPGLTIQEISDGVWRIESIHGSTIVNYSEFNLFLGQEARFLLPDGNSRILNRVSQLDPSLINGLIRSNGIVYLVNPAGVVFDGNAVVDVAGFYAAAGDISDADFLSGNDRFFLEGDVLVNAGAQLASSGDLHLIGQHVANHGAISSEGGVITMLAGDKVVLSKVGGRIMVTVDGIQLTDRDVAYDGRNGNRSGRPAVENTGTIRSDGGRVILGAGDIASLAIRNAGSISAAGGEVELVANGGLVWNDAGASVSADDVVLRAPRIDVDFGSTLAGSDVLLDAVRTIRLHAPLDVGNDLTVRTDGLIFVEDAILVGGDAVFAGRDIFLRGGTVDAGGTQTFDGDLWLGTDTELTATDVFFNGMVNSKSVQVDPLCSLVVNGNATFNGTVGFGFPPRRLRSLTVNGASHIAGGVVGTADFQRYLGPVTLGADALLFSDDAGLIQFGGTVDGPWGLDVRTAGRTRFDGVVGGAAPLASVTTDAPGDTIIGADMTAGAMTFGDAVKLGADARLTGRDSVSFLKTVAGRGHDLTIDAPLTFFGDDATGFGRLRTDADGETLVEATRITGEKIDFRDRVTMRRDVLVRGSRFVKFGDTLDGDVDLRVVSDRLIELGGDVGGETAFATIELRSGGRDVLRENVIVIDGRLVRATGDIRLNPQGKSEPSLVASIASLGDVEIKSREGDVRVGVNEKITSLGDLRLVARNGSVVVNDLNAIGDIRAAAERIVIRRRAPGRLFDFNGLVLGDAGTDVIAIGDISGSTTPTFVGEGRDPVFATGLEGAVRLLLPALVLGELRPEMFRLNPILDLSGGIRSQDIASAFDDDADLRVEDRVKLDPVALRALGRLGLTVRPMSDRELLAGTTGRELYLDVPRGGLESETGLTVSAHRMRRDSMIRVVDTYATLFLREYEDPDTGETVTEERLDAVRDVLAQAWTAYVNETGEDPPTAEGFRTWLELTPAHAEALAYLDGMGDLFRQMWTMGASRNELRASVDTVLGAVCPTGMEQAALERAIRVDGLLG